MAVLGIVETHPDDLTLSFGACVDLHIQAGHQVYSLSAADGSGSGAQAATGLSTAEFVAARDDEMKRANRAIGIRFERIIIPPNRPGGGALTPGFVADIVGEFVTAHPGAWIKAYSPLPAPGRHPDHVASGQGVALLHDQGVIADPRYYIEPWNYVSFHNAHPTVKLSPQRATVISRIQQAFREYTVIDRKSWKYGIGGLSVGDKFDDLYPDPVNYWHMPV